MTKLYCWSVVVDGDLDDADFMRLDDAVNERRVPVEDTFQMIAQQVVQEAAALAGITAKLTVRVE